MSSAPKRAKLEAKLNASNVVRTIIAGTFVDTPHSTFQELSCAQPKQRLRVCADHVAVINADGIIIAFDGKCSSRYWHEAMTNLPDTVKDDITSQSDADLRASYQDNHGVVLVWWFSPRRFLLPGLIDLHVHAPQYSYSGTATDKPLMQWLDHYTFPAERRMRDLGIAREVYTKLLSRLAANGTTTGELP